MLFLETKRMFVTNITRVRTLRLARETFQMDIKILLEQKDGKMGETTAGEFIDSIHQIRITIQSF